MTVTQGWPGLPRRAHIREVGPRDGLQNEDVVLATADKLRLIDALGATGLTEIEVGAFVRPQNVPQMADTAEVFATLRRRPGVVYSAIAPNTVGARRAMEAGADAVQVFLSASESHNQSNVNMGVEQSLANVAAMAAIVREAGKPFDAVLSVAFGCPFEGDVPIERVLELCGRLLDLGAQQLTLGDTTGMGHPVLVRQVCLAFQERFPRQPLRLHLHSARGAGLANILAALEVGIFEFDSSVGGIGGCPFAPAATGNIATEDLVYLAERSGYGTGYDLEKLIALAPFISEGLGGILLPAMVSRAGPFPKAAAI